MKAKSNDFNKKYEFFFFSPRTSELKYERYFEKEYDDRYDIGIMYSPLYILRREINKLCHAEVPYAKSPKFSFAPYTSRYAALLLADIAITGIVFNITAENAGEKATVDDFKFFYKEYLKSDDLASFLMRCLRNSLQHNFFGMQYNLRKAEARILRQLTQVKQYKNITLCFNPVWDEDNEIFESCYWSGTNFIIHLNFAEYFRRLESGFKKLKREVVKSSTLKRNFAKNIIIENWVPAEIEP